MSGPGTGRRHSHCLRAPRPRHGQPCAPAGHCSGAPRANEPPLGSHSRLGGRGPPGVSRASITTAQIWVACGTGATSAAHARTEGAQWYRCNGGGHACVRDRRNWRGARLAAAGHRAQLGSPLRTRARCRGRGASRSPARERTTGQSSVACATGATRTLRRHGAGAGCSVRGCRAHVACAAVTIQAGLGSAASLRTPSVQRWNERRLRATAQKYTASASVANSATVWPTRTGESGCADTTCTTKYAMVLPRSSGAAMTVRTRPARINPPRWARLRGGSTVQPLEGRCRSCLTARLRQPQLHLGVHTSKL